MCSSFYNTGEIFGNVSRDVPGLRLTLFLCLAWFAMSACPLDINQAVRIVLYSIIFLLSIFGNSLIIVVLVRNRRMRTVTNLFLLSLAVSDLMLCLFCMPFTLIPNLMKDFVFGSTICKGAMYFMGESHKGVLVTVQIAVCQPETSNGTHLKSGSTHS